MAIKAVIFDYAGVVGLDAYWSWLKDNIADLEQERPYFQEISHAVDCCEISPEEFVERIALKAKRPRREIENEILERMRVFPEVVRLLAQLKPHYKIGLLSNFIYSWLHPVLQQNHIYQYFDDAVISTEVRLRKPHKAIYLLAAKRLGVNPEEALFVDDREENLLPARELGMKTLLAGEPAVWCGQLLRKLKEEECLRAGAIFSANTRAENLG